MYLHFRKQNKIFDDEAANPDSNKTISPSVC